MYLTGRRPWYYYHNPTISIFEQRNWHTKDVLKFYCLSFHQQHDLAVHAKQLPLCWEVEWQHMRNMCLNVYKPSLVCCTILLLECVFTRHAVRSIIFNYGTGNYCQPTPFRYSTIPLVYTPSPWLHDYHFIMVIMIILQPNLYNFCHLI